MEKGHHKTQTSERSQRNRGKEVSQTMRPCVTATWKHQALRRETTGKDDERNLWEESGSASQKAFGKRFHSCKFHQRTGQHRWHG